DVNDIPMLLVDQDKSPESRELVRRFTGSGYFTLAGGEESVARVDRWLVEGRAQLALVIGAGYGDAIASGRRPSGQMIAGGSDWSSPVVGLGYASRLIAGVGAEIVAAQLPARLKPGRLELVPRVLYNPDLKSRWFYVPAVLAMVLMLVTMMLPSMAVVREKE